MTRVTFMRRLAALSLLLPIVAMAQSPSPEDFARHAEVSEVALSPDGKYVAMAVPSSDGMETQLHIVPLDGSGKAQALRFGRQQHVTDIVWSSNDQLVVARARMEPLKARPYSYGELMSSDVNGKNQETLFAYILDDGMRSGRRKDEGFAQVVKVLDDEPGMVLVDFTNWPTSRQDEERPTRIYKVDTRSGKRQEIEVSRETAVFMFDHAGRARLKITTDTNDNPALNYRPGAGNDWQPVPKSLAGYNMRLLYVEPDNNTAYATITDKGEPKQLYKIDLAKGTRVRLAGRDDVEISRVMYGGHDGDILPPVGGERDREALHRSRQPRLPEHLAGLDVDGFELAVEIADERDTAARRDDGRQERRALLERPELCHRPRVVRRELHVAGLAQLGVVLALAATVVEQRARAGALVAFLVHFLGCSSSAR